MCTEEGNDSINDFFGVVSGGDVLNCLGCEDDTNQHPSTGQVDILPFFRGKLSGYFVF
jgi:hypothetical protein